MSDSLFKLQSQWLACRGTKGGPNKSIPLDNTLRGGLGEIVECMQQPGFKLKQRWLKDVTQKTEK